jgi:hypothetical protein
MRWLEFDLPPRLDWVILFPCRVLVNFIYFLACLACLILWYKFYTTPDGRLRKALLPFFGWAAVSCLLTAIVYHPAFNLWWIMAFKIPVFLSLIRLTWYILRHYGLPPQD